MEQLSVKLWQYNAKMIINRANMDHVDNDSWDLSTNVFSM